MVIKWDDGRTETLDPKQVKIKEVWLCPDCGAELVELDDAYECLKCGYVEVLYNDNNIFVF